MENDPASFDSAGEETTSDPEDEPARVRSGRGRNNEQVASRRDGLLNGSGSSAYHFRDLRYPLNNERFGGTRRAVLKIFKIIYYYST